MLVSNQLGDPSVRGFNLKSLHWVFDPGSDDESNQLHGLSTPEMLHSSIVSTHFPLPTLPHSLTHLARTLTSTTTTTTTSPSSWHHHHHPPTPNFHSPLHTRTHPSRTQSLVRTLTSTTTIIMASPPSPSPPPTSHSPLTHSPHSHTHYVHHRRGAAPPPSPTYVFFIHVIVLITLRNYSKM